jgi:hypothetical protein
MPTNNSPQSLLFAQRDGFHQLPSSQGSMASTQRDHLEEIPLEKVVTSNSVTGARKPSFTASHVKSSGLGPRRPHLGRRKTSDGLGGQWDKDKSSAEEGTMNRMGRIYQKVIHFSVITRWSIYVIPVALILAIPIFVGVFADRNATIQGVKMYWFFAWIEVGTKYFIGTLLLSA